ncbi:hypothetical protein ACFX2I_004549 [Malus domestica]
MVANHVEARQQPAEIPKQVEEEQTKGKLLGGSGNDQSEGKVMEQSSGKAKMDELGEMKNLPPLPNIPIPPQLPIPQFPLPPQIPGFPIPQFPTDGRRGAKGLLTEGMVGNGNGGIEGILGIVGKPGNGSKKFIFSTGLGSCCTMGSLKYGTVGSIWLLKVKGAGKLDCTAEEEESDPKNCIVDGFFSSNKRLDAKHK